MTFFGKTFLANGTLEWARARAAGFQAIALESLSAAFGAAAGFVVDNCANVFFVVIDGVVKQTIFDEFDIAGFFFNIVDWFQELLLTLLLR